MYWLPKIKRAVLADPRRSIVVGALGIFLLVGGAVALMALVTPRPRLLLAGESKQSIVAPIAVKFSLPPSRRDLSVTVTPETPVSVSWTGGVFGHFARTMVITPDDGWQADTAYQISFSDVSGAVGFGNSRDVAGEFATQIIPTVAAINVSGATDVRTDGAIAVQLSAPTENVAEFFFTLDPPADFSASLSGDIYSLTFNQPLRQGQRYQLIVERQVVVYNLETKEVEKRLNRELVSETSFTTKGPVLVESFSPQGLAVLPTNREIIIGFGEPVLQDDVIERLAIEPALAGSWRWENDRSLQFSAAADLPIDTNYVVTLPAGVKAASGSYTADPQKLTFKTVGALRIVGSTPGQNSNGVGLTSRLTLTFDQPTIETDVASNLSISPAVDYSTSWSGNVLTITPKSALSHYQTYTVGLGVGVRSQFGKPLAGPYSLKFTTEQKRVVLPLALDKQDRSLSCEAAALKMALWYRGIQVSEGDIMAAVGYDPTIKNGNVWGDPDVAFVGNIDGSQNSTGYGVHWQPIANAATLWRPAKAFSGWNASQLAWEIEAGNPVIIWGVLGGAYLDPWYTPTGRYIAAWKGEHARTVIGYTGSPANPASFIINDPIAGRLTWSTSKLLADWSKFNNSGVVIY